MANLESAELYDPTKGKWTLTGSITVPREGHDAALLQNGQVLVAGGINASLGLCGTLGSAEMYNPSTGTWTATGSMTTGRYSFVLDPDVGKHWKYACVTTRRNHDRAC